MRILFLTSELDVSNGWGRYSAGFLAQARARYGEAEVVAPDSARLHAKPAGWHRRLSYPLIAAFAAWRLRGEAKGVELIHAATEPVLPHAFFLSLFLRVPYVVSAHGTYGDLRTYPSAISWFYRLAFRRASRIAAVSGYTARIMREQSPQAKIEIVPGGFAASSGAPKARMMSGARRILAVGAFKPRKGFHTLVEALGLLKKEGVAFHADIVGPIDAKAARNPDGRINYFGRVEARVTELGLADRLKIHGRVSEEALDRFYAEADLFVLPSEHDGTAFEGLGLVYLEASARGVPVIGCLDSGAEDVIKDGLNGRLVPPSDPRRLADAIKASLGDEEAWKRMSDAAPGSIDRFCWEKVGAEMGEVYKQAIVEYAR